MSDKQFEQQRIEIKKVPERYERLQEIFSLVLSAPAYNNEAEAYVGLENAFETIEGKYYPRFESRARESEVGGDLLKMHVERIENRISTSDGGTVGVVYSGGHYTFIGHNGAIEIQNGEGGKTVHSNPNNTVVFEKKGADGKGVWE